MTLPLSERATALSAIDISRIALERAREHCRSSANIQFMQLDLLCDDLSQQFDAIVCAGVLVFLPAEEQTRIRDRLAAALVAGGDLVLEHTREVFPGEVAGGEIHRLYGLHPDLSVLRHEEVDNYAVTVLRKAS